MRMAVTFENGPRRGETLEFFQDPVRLGSAVDTEVGVVGVMAAEVEPIHAEIAFECGFFILYDAGTSEGTFLNGQRVSMAKLKGGDIIRLGRDGPEFRFEGDPGFGGHLSLLTTTCRVNARMLRAVIRDSLQTARDHDRRSGLAFVQEVMRRSRWQLGIRILASVLVALLLVGGGLWRFWLSERAEKRSLHARLQRIENAFSRRDVGLERISRAFRQSVQARERTLRHEIDTLNRELRTERNLSRAAADVLRSQIDRLTSELGRTRQELLANRSGQFIEVARRNQSAVAWVVHLWTLISKETGKPFFSLGLDPEGNPIIKEGPAPPGASLLTQVSAGSSFAVNEKGWLITNRHVALPWEFSPGLDEAKITGRTVRLYVIFADRKEKIPARVLRASKKADLAVLGVAPFPAMPRVERLSPAPEASPRGASVAVLGFPISALIDGFARTTLTTGVLSKPPLADRLQFDASINPGNSGGPILNVRGEVIGVVESVAATREGKRIYGINFGVPIRLAMDLLGEMEAQGSN